MAKIIRGNQLGLRRIVSGGQTGVDRAALDAAIAAGLPHGGWCPKGRLAEDGTIPSKYKLDETNSTDYVVRTQRNVIDSDGTLILYAKRLQGGTSLTNRLAKQNNKPLLRINLENKLDVSKIQEWILHHRIRVLNVAGPRASSEPTLYERAFDLISRMLNHPILLGSNSTGIAEGESAQD